MLHTTTISGLHEHVLTQVVPRFVKAGDRTLDLGAGPGLLAWRLREMGFEVTAADRDAKVFAADVPFVPLDFNQPGFSARLGEHSFALVTAIEVIEHVESPIGFLREIGRLLRPGGTAVLTTPNVDNAPARVKFLLTGKIRMMDAQGEPTHISPIFSDLLTRQYLPLAGLQMVEWGRFPVNGYTQTRARYAWFFRLLAHVLGGNSLAGDSHILVLQAGPGR